MAKRLYINIWNIQLGDIRNNSQDKYCANLDIIRYLFWQAIITIWCKNAFSHGYLEGEIYTDIPLNFDRGTWPCKVCKVKKKVLYEFKQSPIA